MNENPGTAEISRAPPDRVVKQAMAGTYPIPEDEPERLGTLKSLGLLDLARAEECVAACVRAPRRAWKTRST